jgi:hypothetical protein
MSDSDKRLTSLRRTMQQAIHCVQEALDAHEHKDDPRHVRDDLVQARALIDEVLVTVVSQARGASRADGFK